LDCTGRAFLHKVVYKFKECRSDILVNNGHICTLLVNILNDRDVNKDKTKQNTRSRK